MYFPFDKRDGGTTTGTRVGQFKAATLFLAIVAS